MKKKCLAIAKKAMVWAMAASMLVATPLTASAGLRDVFKVEDQYGNVIGNPDSSGTGTVSSTYTKSTVLENEAEIVGIALNQTDINMEMGYKTTPKSVALEATLITSDGELEKNETLMKSFSWSLDDTSVAALENVKKDGTTNTMQLNAKAGGHAKLTVYLEGTDIKAEATVNVKEYASDLKFSIGQNEQEPDELYVKHTVDMNKYLQRTRGTSNDDIAWSVKVGAPGIATISDQGIVTVKKYAKNKDNTVTVKAVSEKGVVATAKFVVDPGRPAAKMGIYLADDTTMDHKKPYKKHTLDMGKNNEDTVDVKAVMFLKDGSNFVRDNDKEDKEKITDIVTWSSNKPAVIDVSGFGETGNEETVTLVAKSAGKATITAKSSTGKKATIAVTVNATLNSITIDDVESSEYKDGTPTLFSGQSVQMTVTRDPKENNDALKWEILKVDNKKNPNATINSKGVLTIKNKVDNTKPVVVKVTSKKDSTKTDEYLINVDQSNINKISVYEGDAVNNQSKPIAQVGLTNAEKIAGGKTDINVPKTKSFIAKVEGDKGGVGSLVWKTSNAKVITLKANSDGTARITANAKGTATITVSGINTTYKEDGSIKSSKVLKATFKVNVIQPATSLTMNKTLVTVKHVDGKNPAPASVTFTAKVNKNAKDTVKWSVKQTAGNSNAAVVENSSRGKVKINSGYKPGDEFVVTARTEKSGVTAQATIKVVSASFALEVRNEKNEPYANKFDLEVGQELKLNPYVNLKLKKPDTDEWVEAGEAGTNGKVAADVEYTLNNKKGIVRIDKDGNLLALKDGKVTVTAKTADGKAFKMNITVK